MAVGKSRIGRILAERLGLPFVDTDLAVEQAFRMSVADIFQKHGEPAFRRAETDVLKRLATAGRHVIALGGGVFVDDANRGILNRFARTVWIDPPFDLLLPRIRRSSTRPIANSRSDEQLRALWEARRMHYALADVRVEVPDDEPERVADVVLSAVTEG